MTEVAGRRALVLRAVHAVPGAHLRDLQRITGLAWGTLRYHAGVLVEHGDVNVELDRRFLRHYPSKMPVITRRTWDAVRTKPMRRIIEVLLVLPSTQAQLCVELGMAPSTTHRYVTLLRRLDVLEEGAGLLRLSRPQEAESVLRTVDLTLFDELAGGAIGMFDELDP